MEGDPKSNYRSNQPDMESYFTAQFKEYGQLLLLYI